ncbi:MAG TPA: hypothetical protein VK426_05330, partial [Methanobacterium sp.]|nr:hypothetical protein [Methanobacterium sp.]
MEYGGGIITNKFMFAVLLVASMSLVGIASASAADTGTAQIQSGNHHAVAKNIKLHKNDKFLNKSIKTHKKAVKPSKAVK